MGVFPSHFDSVGAVAFTQDLSGKIILASGSGQRHFDEQETNSDDSDEEQISV